MKETIKITFGAPRHLPSAIDGIEFMYPYQIQRVGNDDLITDQEKPVLKYVKVSISGSLAITWGFQIWREEKEYNDLKKLLSIDVLNYIKEKLKNRTLQDVEHLIIDSFNHPPTRLYNVNEIPEVDGYEVKIEF